MNKLTVSDWIAFLSAEKHGLSSSALNVGALLLSFVAILFSIQRDTLWDKIAGAVIVLAFLVVVTVKVFVPLQKQGDPAQKILKRIMKDDLIDPEKIRIEWLKLTEGANQSNKVKV
jgi:hypothetical protein